MPDILPFRGLRYAAAHDLSTITAPPYDVVDDDERAALERSDEHNAVRLILPRDTDTQDRYAAAAGTFASWRRDGVLTPDATPSLYAYRMVFDDGQAARHTVGVIGALALPAEGTEGDVLPHERTLHKARSDRLNLLRATRANLDPIWVLSLGSGLTDLALAALAQGAAEVAMEGDGTRHELVPISDPAAIGTIRAAVAAQPVVLADGHHRFETACAYRGEQPGDAGAGAIMALVVELSDDELWVHPIHRLVRGALTREQLADAFEIVEVGPNRPENVPALVDRMDAERALGLVDARGSALLVPRPEVLDPRLAELSPVLHDVDSARFDVAIAPLLEHAEIEYRDDAATLAALVDKGAADAAILLRPVPVETIRAAAQARERMPQKTTFFAPKPRTGMVFRSLDD